MICFGMIASRYGGRSFTIANPIPAVDGSSVMIIKENRHPITGFP
jgi:hypothetical protein